MTDRLACTSCGALILRSTAEKTQGRCMPCATGTRASIEAGKRWHREQKERDRSPLRLFWKDLVHRVHNTGSGFSGLKDAEKLYFAVETLDGDVYNGGFEQYFGNSSASHYVCAVEGLRKLGANQALALVEEATLLLLSTMDVPEDTAERRALLRRIGEENKADRGWQERLNSLHHLYWQDPDRIGDRLREFAIAQAFVPPNSRPEAP